MLWVHATSPGIIGMNITASKTGQHQPQQHSSALQRILKPTDSVTKYHQIRETERDILIKLPDIQLGYIYLNINTILCILSDTIAMNNKAKHSRLRNLHNKPIKKLNLT